MAPTGVRSEVTPTAVGVVMGLFRKGNGEGSWVVLGELSLSESSDESDIEDIDMPRVYQAKEERGSVD